MTTRRMLHAAALGLLAGSVATSAFAQLPACQPGSGPFDHLKCYRIATKTKIKAVADLTPLQQQLLKETNCKLVGPAFFCAPVCKDHVQPPPQGAPAGPQETDHLCYKISCPKPLPPNLTATDQFGTFDFKIVKARLLCTPARKTNVSTTSTSTSTSTTTSTTIRCQAGPAGCIGGCQDPTEVCQKISATVCDCVKMPACCECGTAPCLNTNGVCPAGCQAVPNGTCNAATGHCQCGSCNDAGLACNGTPCSANQPCPGAPTVFCDPNCPPGCDPCAQQPGQCNPVQCLKLDGTPGQCHPGSTGCSCQ